MSSVCLCVVLCGVVMVWFCVGVSQSASVSQRQTSQQLPVVDICQSINDCW